MSFLDRLKTKLADAPEQGADDPGRPFARYAHAFGGFEGAQSGGVCGDEGASEGFEGSRGRHVSQPGAPQTPLRAPENASLELLKSRSKKQIHARSRGQTPLPQPPSEPSKGEAPPLAGIITSDHVRTAIERELRALAGLGVLGSEARARAIAIAKAKIGNSEALAEPQAQPGRCQQCGERFDDSLPVIAVMGCRPDHPLHMHDACHPAFRARRRALVDRIMTAAGYGAETEGDAA